MAQQLVEEETGDGIGMRAIGEGGLGGKDVPLEPFEQLAAVRGDGGDLRIVDVRVDETGDDQLARKMFGDRIGEARGQIGMVAACGNQPVLHDQQPVGMMPHRRAPSRIVGHRHDLGAERLERHAATRPGAGRCATAGPAMTAGTFRATLTLSPWPIAVPS